MKKTYTDKLVIALAAFLLLCIGSLPNAIAATGDIGIDIYGLSYHLDQKAARSLGVDNQINPGGGLHYVIRESRREVWFLEAGAYRDSGRRTAKSIGSGYQYKLNDTWRLGGGLVFFNSASYNRGHPFIAPVPLLTYQKDRVAFNLTFFPKVANFNKIATFGAFATIRLGNIKKQ